MPTAIETVNQIKSGKLSAVENLHAHLKVIKEKDTAIGAFLEVFENTALAAAKAIDDKAAKGQPLGALAGVTVGIKDNMLYTGHKMSCASKILEGYVAPYTATAVQKLIDADAIIIGRTNMDEFAMGSSNENSALQVTKNPHDTTKVPGGSSGGSAAAVAAGMCQLALGSDTGGSIRQPAAFCGVYGLKPTYGSVSRYGLTAFGSSLDQIGVFSANARDNSLGFSVISGHDPKDSTSCKTITRAAVPEPGKLKIGLPKDFSLDSLDREVAGVFQATIKKLESLGAKITEVSLPNSKYAAPAYYIVASSEASANLSRFDGVRYGLSVKGDTLSDCYKKTRGAGFGPEVKRRIMLGTYALSAGYYDAYYLKAQKIRTLIKQDFELAFEKVDAILTPTTPTTAFNFGEKSSDPIAMYLSDIFTIPCNLAGICGLSLPAGLAENGLPVGAQLLAAHGRENTLFAIAGDLENAKH